MTPHPQAEILRAIADGEEIEAFYDEGWHDTVPRSAIKYLGADMYPLRIKPKVININGIEVPEPMREEPKDGTPFWIIDIVYSENVRRSEWEASFMQKKWLKAGLCHLTKEAAELHANALLSFTRRI